MTWEQLVTDHHATVYRIALGILRDSAAAEGPLASVRLPGVCSGLMPDGRDVTLVLTPAACVTGIATDAEGQPVERTMVHLEIDGEPTVSVPADATGRFVVRTSADPGRKQVLRATCEYPWREGTAVPGGGEVRIVMEEPK
ncbi:MAG: hypothetical protein HYY18_00410 [Planctomycetes bacterium]|nr:hypothetical protein [Planctomycetota bacterium]